MRKIVFSLSMISSCVIALLLTSCASTHPQNDGSDSSQMSANLSDLPPYRVENERFRANYAERLPVHIDTGGKKTVLVDPGVHAWGAYDKEGNLIRAGVATSGASICPLDTDPNEPSCKTTTGVFHITSMGDGHCASKKYPRPSGGGLMPFCMHFNNGEALHGSPDDIVGEANVSHGCVRMRIPDAEWMRYNFASVGTKVVVLPYNQ